MPENNTLSRQPEYRSDDDYRLIEYGYVTDRYPRDSDDCELGAGVEPRIRIEPRLGRHALDALVPQHSVGDRHMPREGEVVYYIRLKDDLGVCLGTRATDHDGYSYERRIDHADTDGLLRWDEEGNLLLNSETIRRNDACEQITHPLKTGHLDVTEGNLELLSKILTESGTLKTGHLNITEGNLELLSKILTESGTLKTGHLDVTEGNLELLSKIDDGTVKEGHVDIIEGNLELRSQVSDGEESTLNLNTDLVVTLADGVELTLNDVAKLTTKYGDTIEFDDTGSLVINGGTTPVVTDVSANVTTTTDSDGYVTDVSVNLDVTKNESILVDGGQQI